MGAGGSTIQSEPKSKSTRDLPQEIIDIAKRNKQNLNDNDDISVSDSKEEDDGQNIQEEDEESDENEEISDKSDEQDKTESDVSDITMKSLKPINKASQIIPSSRTSTNQSSKDRNYLDRHNTQSTSESIQDEGALLFEFARLSSKANEPALKKKSENFYNSSEYKKLVKSGSSYQKRIENARKIRHRRFFEGKTNSNANWTKRPVNNRFNKDIDYLQKSIEEDGTHYISY